MRNQSVIDLIGWGLIVSILIGLTLLLSSCTVTRLTAPTADDLAGSPMVYKVTVPIECEHFYIRQAYTINDIRTGADYHPCICLHCKIIEVCK